MAGSSLPHLERERELHQRLLAKDKTAPVDFAEAYFEPLVRHLRQHNARTVPDDLIHDAVYEAWENLCENPQSYDGKGSLWSYLRMSAQGDLINAIARERRRARVVQSVGAVEQLAKRGKIKIADTDALVQQEELEVVRRDLLPIVQAGLSEGELRCLELYLDGERKTGPYAEALGIMTWPKPKSKLAVKRVKDKLEKRITRARGRVHEEDVT